jgi:capsular polysaccharide biosynthesis protein
VNDGPQTPDNPPAVGIVEARTHWAELYPQEQSAPAIPLGGDGLLRYPPHLKELHESSEIIAPLGVSHIPNCQLNISGLLTIDGRLVREGSPLPEYSEKRWRKGELMPNGALFAPASMTIDRPILCLYSAGLKVYGHWLIEFIPRAKLAVEALGAGLSDAVIPLPVETPKFVIDMLEYFAGIRPDRILRFDPALAALQSQMAIVPSYPHTKYHLHSFVEKFYAGFRSHEGGEPIRLCVTRANYEKGTFGDRRVFQEREMLERSAAQRGYTIVDPATLPLSEQIRLFGSASTIVGEYGSGLHNAIFSRRGTKVGAIGMPNVIQSRIGARFGHVNFYVLPTETTRADGWKVKSVPTAAIDRLFDALA